MGGTPNPQGTHGLNLSLSNWTQNFVLAWENRARLGLLTLSLMTAENYNTRDSLSLSLSIFSHLG